jgi:hypothetical protein
VPTPLKTSLATPSRCALQCRVHLPPRPPVGPWRLIINYPTLRYKRLGWTPLLRSQKKKRLSQDSLDHNTTQFSCGRSVLRSDRLNHINYRIHRVHLELTTKWLKTFPTKEPQRPAPVKVSQNHFNNQDNKFSLTTTMRAEGVLINVLTK